MGQATFATICKFIFLNIIKHPAAVANHNLIIFKCHCFCIVEHNYRFSLRCRVYHYAIDVLTTY